MRTIVVATQNAGKVTEIKKMLEDLDVEVKTMDEAGIDLEIEETGTTFEENAIIKAEALKAHTDAIILADDSGLEIDHFGKEPGVYSARYLGKDTPYTVKNQIILDRLQDVPKEQRTARFVCVMAVAAKDITTITTRGTIEGYIGYEARGTNGFGYDPIFFVEAYNTSTADMCSDLKNAISHRGEALRQMKERLKGILEVSK
ncbi:XTP/dITP diphosphatase [Cellulosilyticum sp. I15G10I2]|uniref:XTP/dITP diphosphatase n=1 Tax=Cellulosilyticum sp. I15G10I2 TaxID=1892843 RepID=UPI00085C10A0|nr:XTP/dITP diphosphatase [Cellulosilyticum sp. I15G10I2]